MDYGGVFYALLIDWPKAFNCISHGLYIVKVVAYGFRTDAVNLVYDHLSNRRQSIKVKKTFGSWKDIEYGVPQGSILGALLFNIHLCEPFYFLEDLDIASYADGTKIHTVKENKESVINALEALSLPLFILFNNNFMKANSDKSHLLLNCSKPSTALIDGFSIGSNAKAILLGITIDKDLKCNDHVNDLCKKVCQKLNALDHLAPLINVDINESFYGIAVGTLPISLDVP